jgi:hypothetical protein
MVGVFLCRDNGTTPLALRAEVEHTNTLPEKVVIVSVDTISIPHVDTSDRCAVEVIGHGLFKVVHLTARFGYHDKLSIPEALALAREQGLLARNLDLEHAFYFVSRITVTPTEAPGMQHSHNSLFIAMPATRQARSSTLGCPPTAPSSSALKSRSDHPPAGTDQRRSVLPTRWRLIAFKSAVELLHSPAAIAIRGSANRGDHPAPGARAGHDQGIPVRPV